MYRFVCSPCLSLVLLYVCKKERKRKHMKRVEIIYRCKKRDRERLHVRTLTMSDIERRVGGTICFARTRTRNVKGH